MVAVRLARVLGAADEDLSVHLRRRELRPEPPLERGRVDGLRGAAHAQVVITVATGKLRASTY